MVHLREILKNQLLVFRGDADAGIGHRKDDIICRPGRAETRTSPRSVNFRAFEIKFRRIWEILPSSENIGGNVVRILEDQIHRLIQQQGPQHAAQGGEQIRHANSSGLASTLPASTLARSSRSLTRSSRSCAALRM